MTYKELFIQIANMTDEQREYDVMIEVIGVEETFYPNSLRICDSEHDKFDEGDPVIFVP